MKIFKEFGFPNELFLFLPKEIGFAPNPRFEYLWHLSPKDVIFVVYLLYKIATPTLIKTY